MQTKKIDNVFRTMQQEKKSMAIVRENNRTVGLLSFDDAVEEMVGILEDDLTR